MGLTQDEKKLYSQLFKALDPEGSGIVTGEKARATFEKLGLPPNILGEIWQLADHNNLGLLTQFGFCYAMRLIGYTQAGHYPSAALADSPGLLPKFASLNPAPSPLNPQSTSNLFLHTQPSSLIPQNTATQQTQPQEAISPVAPQDYARFCQMFVKTTGSESTPLDGNSAKEILMKAKLPTATLGQIWGLVDVNNRGLLEMPAFVVAMHLIHGVLSGQIKQLPPFLPEIVWQSADKSQGLYGARQTSYSSISSQQSTVRHPPSVPATVQEAPAAPVDWTITSAQKQQFDAIFDGLDKAKTGKLDPNQVASFLMSSRLGQQDLASIWDLADIGNTGVFTKLEFAIALHLVNRKRLGFSLPNIVPDELISSIGLLEPPQAPSLQFQPQSLQPQPQQPPQLDQSARSAAHAPKSSIDELADIFGSAPAPAALASPQRPPLQSRASSSDLAPSTDLPKVRKQLTSSFKPTSTFGQSLLTSQQTNPIDDEHPSLIGEDVPTLAPAPAAASPAPAEPVKSVDYEALRSVPPPPPPAKRETTQQFQAPPPQNYSSLFPQSPSQASPSMASPVRTPTYQPGPQNNDLLADSEVSGKLSEATSDIANVSNQIKSLTGQTSSLHEKKSRAEHELTRILSVKEEIDTKLKQLRASYSNEVKLVEQVEATLTTAKEETEALRSEASISEAKLNHLSGELHEKQVAVEELQKTNSALREKLGYFNAEIVELEKQLESKFQENALLSNEVNVRRSQAQVAFVKVDDLKSKIAELEASHVKAKQDIAKAEQERLAVEAHARELQAQHEELKSKPLPQVAPQAPRSVETSTSSGSGISAAITAVAGAAVGGVAGLAGAHLFSKSDELPLRGLQTKEAQAQIPGSLETVARQPQEQVQIPGSLETVSHQAQEPPAYVSDEQSVSDLVDDVKESQDEAGANIHEENATKEVRSDFAGGHPTSTEEVGDKEYSVADLVDEVLEKPTESLTGVDDFEKPEHKVEPTSYAPPDYENQDLDDLKDRFPEMPSGDDNYQETNPTGPSSFVTDSYRQTGTNETPVTSPDNSEYHFQSAAGVVGGMVGMPGVLVGVQRTDSLTSSIQNNPSMSVRDDNIDDVSERETLDGEVAASPRVVRGSRDSEGRLEESSEGERVSSGVGLFEMVNADEARGLESQQTLDGGHPLAQSFISEETSRAATAQEDEFPPIKELEYDESSSSDEETPDKFDDAVDHLGGSLPVVESGGVDEFDAFSDLKPATQENAVPDMFDDEFDDLKIAEDDADDFGVQEEEIPLDNHFTGADDFVGGFAPSTAPDFAGASTTLQPDANDEWEQLFAGFGNAPAAVPEPVVASSTAMNPGASKDLAVQELVGMGFDESTVFEALTKLHWDVEAATNYLLDHA